MATVVEDDPKAIFSISTITWSRGCHNSFARGVIVIVVGNGHGDTSSNPGRDW